MRLKPKRSEVLLDLDKQLAKHGITPTDFAGFDAPIGLDLKPIRPMDDLYSRSLLKDPAFTELEADLEKHGYEGISGGKEQFVYAHPATDLLYKVPNIFESCPSNGESSMIAAVMACLYSGADDVFAPGALSTLFWHKTGFPVLVQEKLTDVYEWRNRAPNELGLAAPLMNLVQVGFSSIQDRFVVYDFDGMYPIVLESEEWQSAYYETCQKISKQQLCV